MAEPAGPPPMTRTSHDVNDEGDSEETEEGIVSFLGEVVIGTEYTQDAVAMLGDPRSTNGVSDMRSSARHSPVVRVIAGVHELC